MPIYGAVIYGAALISAPACRHHGAVVSLWVGDLWGSADLWVRDLWGSDVWGGTDVCVLSATGITVLWFLWVGDLWGNANLWVWDVWVWDLYGAVLMCIVCRRHHGAVVAVGLGSMGQCCVGQ